ncbi:SGNH/GDSL hydrolase family protein [Kitasatospora sp. YST-16]|uniref:SGNH/GDSL hydrolase family protein n=1 Tax=Kitasatospora sp. YST-16 TaxID=2998080 RepID=UPI0022848E9A|nr:SGNH/GDSL hydrolase family protein [Kitasatospora sp. YST-16]WAL74652.1 SGNH/GDSL hydrolase family protein [Kitasatospora sp. YST-16]WNW40710.1 SGNH/GDSL hydrolase family protein [Streptomyces sp. Li-HN-5-13]
MRKQLVRLFAPLTLLAAVGVSAAPADAVTPAYNSATKYVAMGDSFSAGVGAPFGDPTCGRSPLGYPTLWAQDHGITSFTDVSCGGAVTEDVLANQVSALSADTNVVTITIGGNDTAWGEKVLTCMNSGDAACTAAVDQAVADMAPLAAKLDATYTAIRQAAPNATVYVLGYPLLFEETSSCSVWIAPNQFQRKELNRFAKALDQTIAGRAANAGFTFVDAQPTFAGHAVCSSQAWLYPIANLTPLHPTPDGYRYGYFAALKSATG